MFDIAIIGLGPAGANFARLIDGKYKIIAIDKKTRGEASFKKPCGGLLAPDAQKALAHFNLTLPKHTLVDPQIFSVKTIDLDTTLIRNYQRMYINVDRHKFDLWLKSLIPQRVLVESGAVCSKIIRTDKGFDISYCAGEQEKTISAKYIIGADGANSFVRRSLFPKIKFTTYVSIQQWFKEENAKPFYSCIFDSKSTDCYSWSVSKDGYFIFGGAYGKKGCRQKFANQKEALKQYGFIFGEPIKTEACMVLRPKSMSDFYTGADNAFLIGEAAGFISPSSLEGISSALKSSSYLSDVFNTNTDHFNHKYNKKVAKIKRKLFCKIIKCPFLFYPPLRKLAMLSRFEDINVKE